MQPGTSASLITISSIVLLIFYCVSRSSLADLTNRPVQLCRSRWRFRGLSGDISPYLSRESAVHTSRTLKTFGWRSKESLGALWLRNNAAEAEKYLFKWNPPSLRRQQEQSPWWLSENKLAKLVASTTNMEPVPELGCELSLLFTPNQGCVGELTVAGSQSFATEKELQRKRKEKTERRWSHRAFTSRLGRQVHLVERT